ncbi:MAG: protein kinase [Candidatus Riflebacteria bacterium]|nr:protein kinase [Candidatus Riflebacteria bacterium]
MIGTRIGNKYEIKSFIADSHLFDVYSAVELETGTVVALKLMKSDVAQNVERVKLFTEEVSAFARISHQNVVHVLDFDSEAGRPYVVSEKICGTEILKIARSETMSFVQCMKTVQAIGSVLQQAFSDNIEQRSIKLSNVLRDERGKIKILSFSFPKLRLIEKSNPSDPYSGIQSDIFFLGSTLFELLSGESPIRKRGGINECWDDMLRKAMRTRHQQFPPEEIEKVVELVEKCFTRNMKSRLADHSAFLMKVADLISLGEKFDRKEKSKSREKPSMSASEVVDAIHGRIPQAHVINEVAKAVAAKSPVAKTTAGSEKITSLKRPVARAVQANSSGANALSDFNIGLAPAKNVKQQTGQISGNLALAENLSEPATDDDDDNIEPGRFGRPILQLINGGKKAASGVFWKLSDEPTWYRNPFIITGSGLLFMVLLILFW